MLAPVAALLATALAAAPTQALPEAQWAIEVPSFSATPPVLTFFERAGEHSTLVRPESWLGELHPFLVLDPRSPQSFEESGVDPAGPLVTSGRGRARMACVKLRDPERFEALALSRLEGVGPVRAETLQSVRTVRVERQSRPFVGYARKGDRACAVVFDGRAEPLLRAAVAALSRVPRTSGPLRLWSTRARADVTVEGNTLHLDGTASAQRDAVLPLDRPPRRLAQKGSGLFFLEGAFEPRALAQRLEPDLLSLCGACGRTAVHAFLQSISSELTGDVVWRADKLRPRADLGSRRGLLRSLVHAGGVALARPDETARKLPALLAPLNAEKTDEGWVLPLEGAPLTLSIAEGVLWFHTEASALASLREGTRAASTPSRGAHARIDGPSAAAALRRLSLLDALRNPDVAPLLAASAELGPTLEATVALEVQVRPSEAGAARFSLLWQLR